MNSQCCCWLSRARRFAAIVFCPLTVGLIPLGRSADVRLTFDANNDLKDVTFFAERRADRGSWSADPVVIGAGLRIGRSILCQDGVTAERHGNEVTTSAEFFTSDCEGKEIHWETGPVDRITKVENPTVAYTKGTGEINGGAFRLQTDRVLLVDVGVPTGFYFYRVAARSVDAMGATSDYSNMAVVDILPEPGIQRGLKSELESAPAGEVQVAVLNFRFARSAVIITRPDGSHQISWS